MEKQATHKWMGAEYELRGVWSKSQNPDENWCEEFEIIGPDGDEYTSEFNEVFDRIRGTKSIRELMNATPKSIKEVFEEWLWENGE